jgi:type I site-specific restriction endonuclease
MEMISERDDLFGKAIYVYSRAQAIADGVLVDVSKMAVSAGFKIPLAVTDTLWGTFIEWTAKDTQQQTHQDTDGRLWDVLSMLRFAVAKAQETDCIFYKLNIIPRDGKTKKAKLTQLKAVIGAGDNGEPVITIMLPNED